jgi:broad specificity phosphatase PhoE
MSTFYFVRHGLTDAVHERISGRTSGVHLNAAGRAQAAEVGERLSAVGIQAVFSGPLERVREMAAPLCQRLDLQLETSAAFDEVNFGEWTNRTFEELRGAARWERFNSFRSSVAPPEGELMLEVQARAVAKLEELRLRYEAVAIVSHGDIIRGIVAHFLGLPLDFIHRLQIDPGSITILQLEDWGPQLRLLNGLLETSSSLARSPEKRDA